VDHYSGYDSDRVIPKPHESNMTGVASNIVASKPYGCTTSEIQWLMFYNTGLCNTSGSSREFQGKLDAFVKLVDAC